MSALRGKAEMTVCGSPLSRSLLGAKRTCPFALHMSAFDPKRTLRQFGAFQYANLNRYAALIRSSGPMNEATRVRHTFRRCGGDLAACGPRAENSETASDWCAV